MSGFVEHLEAEIRRPHAETVGRDEAAAVALPGDGSRGPGESALDRAVAKYPEVVVRVAGVRRSVAEIAAWIDERSRRGELGLETQSGTTIEGRDANERLVGSWARGHPPVGTEAGRTREAYALVLSMPAGTPREGVWEATRAFARRELDEHRHVSVLDEGVGRVLVHMLMRAAGYDGRRMNLKRTDLRRWRETFAEELRKRGIGANATSRATRAMLDATREREPSR